MQYTIPISKREHLVFNILKSNTKNICQRINSKIILVGRNFH